MGALHNFLHVIIRIPYLLYIDYFLSLKAFGWLFNSSPDESLPELRELHDNDWTRQFTSTTTVVVLFAGEFKSLTKLIVT